MGNKRFLHLLADLALLISTPCPAQDSLVIYNSLSPAIALEFFAGGRDRSLRGPGGGADEACAKAGVDAIQSKLDF